MEQLLMHRRSQQVAGINPRPGSMSLRSPGLALFLAMIAALSGCGGGGSSSSSGTPAAAGGGTPVVLLVAPPPTFAVSFTVTGSGTVTSSPGGITCAAGTCTGSVPAGVYLLTAAPAGGGVVSAWGGACAASIAPVTTCSVTVTGPGSLSASVTFSAAFSLGVTVIGAATDTVSSNSTPGGSPSNLACGPGATGTCSALFPPGTSVTLTANPDPTELFVNWTGATGSAVIGGGGGCPGTTTTCVVPVTVASTITANFVAAPSGTLKVSVAGGGTVSSTGGTPDVTGCGNAGGSGAVLGVCAGVFVTGASTVLTGTPAGGYALVAWLSNSGGASAITTCAASAPGTCTFVKTAATQFLTAIFAPSPAAAVSPLVLYTDIVSGPLTGGEANNGIYLSIFGKNFGAGALGTTVKVYLNNVQVATHRSLGVSKGRTDIQQITVQLGALDIPANGAVLPIKVVVNGTVAVDPNGLTFMVNPGRILFVDNVFGNDATAVIGDITKPFRNVQLDPNTATVAQLNQTAWGQVRAGDFMVMRGTGTAWTDAGTSTYFIRFQPQPSAAPSATQRGLPPTGAVDSGPIGLIGYPGEDVFIFKDVNFANFGGAISGANTANQALGNGAWVVIANLRVDCGREDGVITPQAGSFNTINGGNWRVVNNDISAASAVNNIVGGIGNALGGGIDGDGLGHIYLGNFIHDIFDGADNPALPHQNHGVYISDTGSYEVAYNRFERIRGGNAIQTFANGTAATGFVDNVNIHHNIISDVGKHGINISDGSRNNIKVWNNVIFNIDQSGIKFNTNNLVGAKIYNNTISNVSLSAGNTCFFNVLDNGGTLTGASVDIRNNIFVAGNVCRAYAGGGAGFGGAFGTATNNLWFNGTATTEIGSSNVLANPQFLNTTPGAEDFHVNPASLAVGGGINNAAVSALVIDDFDIATALRTQTLRPVGAWDIGAYEQ